MKNKIVSIIQNNSNHIDQFLHYNARLAKDFKLNLDFVNNFESVQSSLSPDAILGTGMPKSVGSSIKEVKTDVVRKVRNIVASPMDEYNDISYTVSNDNVVQQMYDKKTTSDLLLWTIGQESEDSFFNQLFGTVETDLSKQSTLPTLTIPQNCDYVKPETMIVVIRNTPKLDYSNLLTIKENLGLRIVYVFHEDENAISTKEIMDSMSRDFKDFTGTVNTISLEDDSLDKIIEHEKPQWIAFANYERSFLERIYKPNSNQFTLSSKLPVLNF